MSGSVNKVILLGRLGRNPEIRSTQSGGRIAKLSIATSEKWKDKNTGETKELTDWHTVIVYNENISGYAEKYLEKGDQVYVEGKLKTRTFDDNMGNRRYVTEVILNGYTCVLTSLGKNRKNGGQSSDTNAMIDDEIPF